MNYQDYLIRFIRKGYRLLTNKSFTLPKCDTNRQSVNDKIFELLASPNPCMIARFGTTELITINNYLCINSNKTYSKKIWEYITDNTHTPWWFKDNINYLDIFSGVFPPTIEMAKKFSERYLEDIPEIDMLGSFQYYEKFMPLKKDVQMVHLETLYPFFVERPWTRVLKGKKVLIIHPFEETIKLQYSNRKLIFNNEEILPDFDLKIIKAVQSAAGIKVPFKDWFEALDYMKKQIEKTDFDICILGCGAYGLPLAADIKRMGKKAIHLGGGTQLLFGIKGKRWDKNSNYGSWYNIPNLFNQTYSDLYNDYWIKPLQVDTPKTAEKLDNAQYW